MKGRVPVIEITALRLSTGINKKQISKLRKYNNQYKINKDNKHDIKEVI